MKQLVFDEKDSFSIYKQFLYEKVPSAKQVAADAGWGVKAAKEMRCKDAMKINEALLWKDWPSCGAEILSGTIVGYGKKPSFVIVWVGEEKFYL